MLIKTDTQCMRIAPNDSYCISCDGVFNPFTDGCIKVSSNGNRCCQYIGSEEKAFLHAKSEMNRFYEEMQKESDLFAEMQERNEIWSASCETTFTFKPYEPEHEEKK